MDNINILDFILDDDSLKIEHKANFVDEKKDIYDLYIKLTPLDFSFDLEKCLLFWNETFIQELYFREIIIKDLLFKP